MSENKTTEHIQ